MPLIYDGRGCTRRELATIASSRMRNRESGIRGGSYPDEPVNPRERERLLFRDVRATSREILREKRSRKVSSRGC